MKLSKEEFVADLYAFMQRVGQPITKTPFLGYQELDLHRLFHLVQKHGGADEVTRKQEWKLVYQELEIPTMSTSASYNTRTNYKKYLYLYELEHLGTPEERKKDAAAQTPTHPARFQLGDWVRIESSTLLGQVFYAQIQRSRFRDGDYSHYVHYNGWSTSHDEWMPEAVLQPLTAEEQQSPHLLNNPPPTRSSKSNYLIYDPSIGDRPHHHYPKERDEKRKKSVDGEKVKRKKSSKERPEPSDTISTGESEAIESLATVRKPSAAERPSRSLRLRLKQPEPIAYVKSKPSGFLGPNWAIVQDELNSLELGDDLCRRQRGEAILAWGQVHLRQLRRPVIPISEAHLQEIGLEFPAPTTKRSHRQRAEVFVAKGLEIKPDAAYLKDRRSMETIQQAISASEGRIKEMEVKLLRLARQLERAQRRRQILTTPMREVGILTPPPSVPSSAKRSRR